jgi:Cys-tRNA(Pro)/Cys-tRNA(Cys) deacylase
MSGKGTPATHVVSSAGIVYRIHEYAHDPSAESYAHEASQALDIEPARVHKTLVIAVKRDPRDELVVAVVPADATCDLKAVAVAAGARKADLADPRDAQRSTGYVLGGISPLGQRQPLTTLIDEEAQLWDTIYVSGGRRGLEIELSAQDLATLTRGTFAPLAKR